MQYEVVIREKVWGKPIKQWPQPAYDYVHTKIIEADFYEIGHDGSLIFLKDDKLVVAYPSGSWFKLTPFTEEKQE